LTLWRSVLAGPMPSNASMDRTRGAEIRIDAALAGIHADRMTAIGEIEAWT